MKNNPLQIICGITGVSSSSFYKRMHDLKQINIEAFHTHLMGWHQHVADFVRLDEPTNGCDQLVCFRDSIVIVI
ncbi:hypothetical protein P9X05_23870 [Bacillus toyonensis]|uniref:hypothetical protein n=1 Tax=Bacillus toyonensis TaxID=155322 RepID=UPI002DB8C3BC|nr:hypothetical protein [Bacillus toyonensis]MEC2394306.1 hypothetical protein [Bacillus toyonensis]